MNITASAAEKADGDGGKMYIRKSTEEDLPRMNEIYVRARRFMTKTGNPNQWGPRNWPPEELLRSDIAAGKS